MDRFHQLEVLVAVADAGSLAAAGRRLGLSPPAVTRTIAALEERLGTRLVNRTTRSLSFTEEGFRYLETARRLLSEWDAADRELVGGTAAPTGQLIVTASVTLGRSLLAPVVAEFLALYPLVSVKAVLMDRTVNLVEEGIDAAVRVGELPDSSLVARRTGQVTRLLVASPGYLARCGMPLEPADLKRHSFIAFTGLMPTREWRHDQGQVALNPRFEINDAGAALHAAERGDGITIALSYMVADALREGRLVRVLPDFPTAPTPVHLVYPQGRIIAPKVRAFIDFATPRLKQCLERLWVQ